MENKEKTDENFKSAYELQKESAQRLYDKCMSGFNHYDGTDEHVKSLCDKHAELINDFAHVKEINRAVATRFDEVTALFPTPNELDEAITGLSELYDEPEFSQRLKTLQSFRKVCVALHENNEKVRPKSYAESVDTEEVQ